MFALFSKGAAALVLVSIAAAPAAGGSLPAVPGRGSYRSEDDIRRTEAVRRFLAEDPALRDFIAARFPAQIVLRKNPFHEPALSGALERAAAEIGLSVGTHEPASTRLMIFADVVENDTSRSGFDWGAMRSWSVTLSLHLVGEDGAVLGHATNTRSIVGISLGHAGQSGLDRNARDAWHALVDDVVLRMSKEGRQAPWLPMMRP